MPGPSARRQRSCASVAKFGELSPSVRNHRACEVVPTRRRSSTRRTSPPASTRVGHRVGPALPAPPQASHRSFPTRPASPNRGRDHTMVVFPRTPRVQGGSRGSKGPSLRRIRSRSTLPPCSHTDSCRRSQSRLRCTHPRPCARWADTRPLRSPRTSIHRRTRCHTLRSCSDLSRCRRRTGCRRPPRHRHRHPASPERRRHPRRHPRRHHHRHASPRTSLGPPRRPYARRTKR